MLSINQCGLPSLRTVNRVFRTDAMKPNTAKFLLFTVFASLFMSNAWSHSEHEHHDAMIMALPQSSQEHAIGKPGDAKRATRTVTVDMFDSMRFGPADIAVKQGETIRFVVVNKGALPHELVLGSKQELKAHAEQMRNNPHDAHDAPGAVRVEPQQKKEIVWKFTKAGTIDFGCLLPGHFEAGMVGKVKVSKG
jgi:uncharacterized cupredoxin-like copper-binding protein